MGVCLPSIETILCEALELPSAGERAAYLDRACGGDEALRRKVEGLLSAHFRAGDFLEGPAATPTVAMETSTPTEDAGTAIGPYKLLETIGEGGMGTVYMAEQTDPVRRKVALKIIKPGMDSKQVVARFEAERQALALMDHPNIARVLDGGTTGSGLPYFVMELVLGLPITEYCDRHQLSIPERLELFVLVCRAVQHAHQKGVIHRDLKPSNVLVTEIDGAAVPKVIDFGVAKATGGALTEKTLYTGFHQFVGTPLYASPEQAELSGVDVDTRSDIYSLGALLYELLTGTTPFDSETLRRASFDEMRRIIRQEEPPRPSTRLGTLGERLSTVSARRKADPRRLGPSIKGELDWVVMKALEKDRRRRYETANDFTSDVMRYLADRPVEAHPPSARYRFAKYARRHRGALTAAVLVLLALTGGLTASLWQAVRATAAEQRVGAALVQAEDHLDLARQAVDELYGEAAARWTQETDFVPLPRPFLEKALVFYRRFAAPRRADPEVGRAHLRVAEILMQLGQRKAAETREALDRAQTIFEALLELDPESVDRRRDLADCYTHQARIDFRHEDLRKVLPLREQVVALRPDVPLYGKELAVTFQQLGNIPDRRTAEAYINRARGMLERLAAEDPTDLDTRRRLGETDSRLAGHLMKEGRIRAAEPYSRRAWAIHDELLTRHPTRPQHWLQVFYSGWAWGHILLETGRAAEARPVLARATAALEGLENDYPAVYAAIPGYLPHILSLRAAAALLTGHPDEAAPILRRLEEIAPEYASTVAWELLWANAPEVVAPAAVVDLARRGAAAPRRHFDSGFAPHVLGMSLYRAGDWDGAIAALAPDQAAKDADQGFNGFFVAMAYHRKGDREQARAWYDRSVARAAEHHPTSDIMERYREEAAALLGVGADAMPRDRGAFAR